MLKTEDIGIQWLQKEGERIYENQNIASLKISPHLLLSSRFYEAVQLLAHLSGRATLTHCYKFILDELTGGSKSVEILSRPCHFSRWAKWEGEALKSGGGESVVFHTEDISLWNTLEFMKLLSSKKKTQKGALVFLCRNLEEAEQFLQTRNRAGVYLACHFRMDCSSLTSRIPFHQKWGLWGDIACEDLKPLYHPRWDFILPEALSHPPSADLFFRHA